MYLQGVENVYDLTWTEGLTYGDVYHQNEVEQSTYNFEHANVDKLFELFDFYESEAKRLIELDQPLPLPSYEMVLKASHTFNLLDARGAISVTERQRYILRVRELAKAVKVMSANKTGALIVIERNMGLNDISATGIQIDGLITADFLLNVFIPNTPLHDGAAIVRGKRLIAAGCLLPLTENRSLSTELGTRHRAAIGLSEQCDALVVVVSEETGTISVAENGRMVRHLDTEKLKNILRPAFTSPQKGLKDLIRNWRKKK